jgi:hypothetical protein
MRRINRKRPVAREDQGVEPGRLIPRRTFLIGSAGVVTGVMALQPGRAAVADSNAERIAEAPSPATPYDIVGVL